MLLELIVKIYWYLCTMCAKQNVSIECIIHRKHSNGLNQLINCNINCVNYRQYFTQTAIRDACSANLKLFCEIIHICINQAIRIHCVFCETSFLWIIHSIHTFCLHCHGQIHLMIWIYNNLIKWFSTLHSIFCICWYGTERIVYVYKSQSLL